IRVLRLWSRGTDNFSFRDNASRWACSINEYAVSWPHLVRVSRHKPNEAVRVGREIAVNVEIFRIALKYPGLQRSLPADPERPPDRARSLRLHSGSGKWRQIEAPISRAQS